MKLTDKRFWISWGSVARSYGRALFVRGLAGRYCIAWWSLRSVVTINIPVP